MATGSDGLDELTALRDKLRRPQTPPSQADPPSPVLVDEPAAEVVAESLPTENILRYGIQRCRDLVGLYFGARIVTTPKTSLFSLNSVTPGPFAILAQDPRRIKYELTITGFNTSFLTIGTQAEIDAETGQYIAFDFQSTLVIARDWITDQDAVTTPLFALWFQGGVSIYVRETILTPAPVDEVPLG